jgi:hypothetical protein
MGAAAFGAVARGVEHDRRLSDQIVELQCLDEIGIPYQRAIADREVVHSIADRRQFARPFVEQRGGAKH